jgi:hypothetical protein
MMKWTRKDEGVIVSPTLHCRACTDTAELSFCDEHENCTQWLMDGQASPMERRHNIDHVSTQSQIAEISPREKAHHRCSRAESKILSHCNWLQLSRSKFEDPCYRRELCDYFGCFQRRSCFKYFGRDLWHLRDLNAARLLSVCVCLCSSNTGASTATAEAINPELLWAIASTRTTEGFYVLFWQPMSRCSAIASIRRAFKY